MRFSHLFETTTGLTLVALALIAPPTALAQTIISNETLVSTTFVVNKTSATAKCGKAGCQAITSMFAAIPVLCPAPMGQTCTFHIFLDTKTSGLAFSDGVPGLSGTGFYRFLVDDAAPTIGPTDQNGDYVFQKYVATYNSPIGPSRESYPASVVAGVTNSTSNSHTIAVSVGCRGIRPGNFFRGCEAIAHWTTMRVDVFEP
jgi:hypothetical protein